MSRILYIESVIVRWIRSYVGGLCKLKWTDRKYEGINLLAKGSKPTFNNVSLYLPYSIFLIITSRQFKSLRYSWYSLDRKFNYVFVLLGITNLSFFLFFFSFFSPFGETDKAENIYLSCIYEVSNRFGHTFESKGNILRFDYRFSFYHQLFLRFKPRK